MESESVAFTLVPDLSTETAVERCREALAAEGFGVLTVIVGEATFKKKLNVERPR